MSSRAEGKPLATRLSVGDTWIVVASPTQARIFRYLGMRSGLKLVLKVQNPQGRLLDQALGADRHGRSFSSGSRRARSAYSDEKSPHEQVVLSFARELADRLSRSRGRNEFRALMLVAESRFLGILKSCLDEQTQKLLVATLDRDYHQKSSSHLSRQVIHYFLAA